MRLGISLSLTQQFGGFSPASLFSGGQQGAWYDPSDLTTLFQDTAGTQPVTAPGQTVALALDKSRGLVLGPELVTSGVFAAPLSISNGVGANQAIGTVVGVAYRVSYRVTAFSGSGSVRLSLGTTGLGLARTATGTYSEVILTPAGGSPNNVYAFISASTSATIDNISVRELPGNHATQATAASRPTYGVVPATGRRNLLTYTEQFDNAAWTKTAATITSNAETAPDGTLTADRVEATGIAPSVSQDIVVNSTSVTLSAYFKKGTAATAANALVIRNQTLGTNLVAARVDLDTGAITYLTGSSGAASESVGNGWWKLTLTASITSGNTVRSGILGGYPATVGHFSFIWGAQLETGSTATAYQRVNSAFDVTEAGVPSLSYLSFDGVDDFLVTPTITPNIDKVQVFAGVRKLSDAATGTAVELSTSGANGSIGMFAPLGAVANYEWRSRGTALAQATSGNTFAAPITNVLTGIGDIAADTAILRANGSQVASSTADQGTGNYLAYPLYIGRRGGTTLPFNGQLYSLIVRFGANLDANTISNTETWVNGKTGAY